MGVRLHLGSPVPVHRRGAYWARIASQINYTLRIAVVAHDLIRKMPVRENKYTCKAPQRPLTREQAC